MLDHLGLNLPASTVLHPPATIARVRWLLHGNLTSATGDALRRHGHQVVELPEVPSDPQEVLATAKKAQLDVLTADAAMAAAPFESAPPFNRSLVFLQLAGGDVEQDDAIDRLFARYKRLTPGRLYTVTGSRVKVRQLPTI
jgi:hypothetical protein